MFFFLVLALAFFAGTEIPLMSITSHKLDAFLRQKRFGAKTLAKLKKKNERLLITNLIGTLLVTSAPTLIAEKYLTPEFIKISGLAPELATTIVYIFAFLTILLFGEIASKIIGVRFNDSVALTVAPIYRVLVFLLLPVTWLVEIFIKVLGWFTGGKFDFHGHKVTQEELGAFIDMSHEGGVVEDGERRQIKNLLGLSDMTAESVMTPRVNVEFLSLDMSVDEACTFLMDSSHSRIPVYGETTDDIEYVITFREAFKLQRDGHGKAKLGALSLEKIMKVPMTQALDDLFEKFQRSRRHIALVLDEHGGTAGVITMEDVLEEVFGDIKDEKDKEEIYIKKRAGGKIEAIGSVLIDDILEEWNMHADDISLPDDYNGESLAYVIMAEEEEFPIVGTEILLGNRDNQIQLKVLEVNDTVIERVECERKIMKE